jgi:predicted Fe-Mo cluster-binding NifX family protein
MSKKIAITLAESGGLDTQMDPRFGRAAAFLIVDADEGTVIAEESNGAVAAAHGAGTAAASTMSRHGVEGVVSGRFGPKAAQALSAMDIAMWTAPSGVTAREALSLYKAGTLRKASAEGF